MPLTPHAGEPPAGPWRVIRIEELLPPAERTPWIVSVDGRSGAGKTTLAARIAAGVPRSGVVHSDDVAWFHSRFDWSRLMIEGVLDPVRRGEAVAYRPPPWDERGRVGAIELPAALDLLVVEGVGVGRADLAAHLDATVWVQSDVEGARERGIERDGGDADARRFWDEWAADEVPFLARDRPWERADVIVAGSAVLPHDPETEVVVSVLSCGRTPTSGTRAGTLAH